MTTVGGLFEDLKPGMVAIVGVPSDENSSFMRGAALAPARIREILHSGEANLSTEKGIDLGTEPRWRDVGNLRIASGIDASVQIESAVATLIEREV